MRTISKPILFTFFISLLFYQTAASGEFLIKNDRGVLTIENKTIRRQFNTHGQFYPSSFFHKKADAECFASISKNWFELGVNGNVLSSAQYISHKQRQMKNGGRQINILLHAENANINYIIQVFPDSAVTRERLEFSPRNKSINLTAINGRIKLVFPRYTFFKTARAQEIRLASWNREQIPQANVNAFPAKRDWDPTKGKGLNLSQCHMYHPAFLDFSPSELSLRKGQILIGVDNQNNGWLIAYEHGSPDNDPSRDFLKIATEPSKGGTRVWVTAEQGAYLNNELVTKEKPFRTVWVDVGVFSGNDLDTGRATFWDFLYHWQSKLPATRKPIIYYNTWGWQRDDQKEYVNCEQLTKTLKGTSIARDPGVHEPLTYYNAKGPGGRRKNIAPVDVLRNERRLLREIDYSHQIGTDVFVLDDGWFDWVGDWNLNPKTFPDGLSHIKARLDGYGMRLGFWLAPYCLNENSRTFAEHPEFMVKDKNGNIQMCRNPSWGYMACMVSGYTDYFIEKCKRLIDIGATYFKWDGLNGQYCYADNHYHGGTKNDPDARGRRYGYEFINTVTRIAHELTQYCPDLVIVYDVTEKGRNIGLEFLSQGRYFWMNNGATWYDDLSTFRTKSIRTVPFRYNQIIPTVLQTFANYPHNDSKYHAQQYNVCTTILGGNGFWGDLSEMNNIERQNVKEIIECYKAVAPTVVATRPRITGAVGSSPEIYEFVDSDKAQGQIIAFSSSVVKKTYYTKPINQTNLLGVLHHGYELENGQLKFAFEFTEPDSVRQAFILGQNTFGARIEKSTCWLKKIKVENDSVLKIRNGAPGVISVFWPENLGMPAIEPDDNLVHKIIKADKAMLLRIEAKKADIEIKIRKN